MVTLKRTRKKTSPIWTITKEKLELCVKKHNSVAGLLRELGYGPTGATHSILKKRLKFDEIDISHFKTGMNSNLGRSFNRKLSKEDAILNIFNDTKYSGTKTLKKYILFYKLKLYCCEKCGNGGFWQNEKLSLQIDHINGDRNNNKLENLRFLCPNCHAQTSSFGARNHRKKVKEIKVCSECKEKIHNKTKTGICLKCKNIKNGRIEQSLIKEEVESAILLMPISKAATKFNCSDSGLKKYCIRHNIKTYSLGYWARRNAGHTHEQALNPVRKVRVSKNLFSREQILEIRSLILADELSLRKIGLKYNRCHNVIADIKHGKTYSHII